MRLIDIGHGYRVSDADAGKLAGAVGRRLPFRAHDLAIVMPQGKPAILARTYMRSGLYDDRGDLEFLPPKRGWIWYVASSHDLSRYTKSSPVVRKAGLARAKRMAVHARKLEYEVYRQHSDDAARALFAQAADAYLVAADVYEEAGDMLLAMRHKTNAEKMKMNVFSGELERRRDRRA